MRLISYSLYGDAPLYCRGAVKNAELAKEVYPGWVLRFYCGPEVPADVRCRLRELDCQVVMQSHSAFGRRIAAPPVLTGAAESPPRFASRCGMFWRLLPAGDPALEYVLFRDCDSRLNVRERAAVDDYIASGKTCHVMRDHPAHTMRIMGGMWGIRGGVLPMETLLADWNYSGQWGDDQRFLARRVWPLVKDDLLCHGYGGLMFPPHPHFKGFVGQIISRDI